MRRRLVFGLLSLVVTVAGAASSRAADAPGALGGRVLAADTGRPLSGVLVTAYSDVRGDARAATSNAQGVFAISGLPPGRYFVDFTCPDGSRYASEAMFVEKGVNRGGGRETTIESGRTRFIEQRLEVGAELELHFEDSSGAEWNPEDSGTQPNLTIVEDFLDGAQRRLIPTATHHEGPLRRVVFQGLPRSDGATVLVQVPGHLGLNPPATRLTPGERAAVVVRLDRGDPTGVEGLAPPGARVVVVSEPEGRQVAEIGADNEGRFAITGFYPGLYGLRVNGLAEGLVDIVRGQRTRVDLSYPDLATQRPDLPQLPSLEGVQPAGVGVERTLELVVRDGSGKMLRDLRPDEIELYQDGVRQEVKSVRHVEGQSAPGGAGALLTIAVDLVSAQGWLQAMSAATDLVSRLPSGTQVAALRLGDSIVPLLPITANREAALQALSAGAPKLGVAAEPSEVQDAMASAAARHARSQGLQLRDHRAIYGLLSIVEAQASLPGRKVLAFLCEGFSLSSEHEGAFRSLIAAANRARVSLYVIDLRGMTAEEQMAVAQAELAVGAAAPADNAASDAPADAGVATADAAVADWQTLLQARANERAVVEELASGTGGFVIANRELLERGLGWIAEDLEHYDEVAYEPQAAPGGEAYRQIKVRVTRPGTRAQHRDGYFTVEPSGGGPLLMYEVPLLRALESAAPPTDFPLHLSTLLFGPAGTGVRVAWLAEMRRADITFAQSPGEAELRGRVAFLTLVKNAQGETILRRSRAFPLGGARERLAELATQRIQFVEYAVLPPGRYTLEAAMQDEHGARVAVRRERLDVPAPRPGLGLSSVVIASGFMTPSISDPSDPLQVRSFRVVPSGDGSARREVGATSIPIYCVVYPIPGASPPDFTVEVVRDGRVVSSGSLRLPAPDNLGSIRHVSSVPLERLHDGAYEVRVRVTQEGYTAEHLTPLDLRPMPAGVDVAALRVIEKTPIRWPEAAPTRRVLLDEKEEKVALGDVKPPPTRRGWSRRKIALATALIGGGAALGARKLTSEPGAFTATPVEGIANVTEFKFSVGSCRSECSWDFGDGSPRATGTSVAHAYSDFRAYDVVLSDGGKVRATQRIYVDSLSASWRYGQHYVDLMQYPSGRLAARCSDNPGLEDYWECSLEGTVTVPGNILLTGSWSSRHWSGEFESRPIEVRGRVVSKDLLIVSFGGGPEDSMERFYGSR